MPELHIITGSNGAGKSTIGPDYLPEYISSNYTVFDGDKLFLEKRRELYPARTKSHKEARNMASEWLEEHFVSLVDEALIKVIILCTKDTSARKDPGRRLGVSRIAAIRFI